jgi:SAM-dependent methyltransferase
MTKNYNGKYAYFGDIVTNYDNDRKIERIWFKENKIVKRLLKKYAPISILDLPVGTGRFFELYQKLDTIKTVIGIDISEDMLLYSKQKAVNMCLDNKFILQKGDAEALNIPPVECIICFRLAHLLPDDILTNVLANLAKTTTKYILFQIYDVILDKKWGKKITSNRAFKILNNLYTRFKNIARRNQNHIKETWLHIENFSHTENSLHALFKKNNLFIRKIYACGIQQNRNVETRIYVLEKK